MNSELIPNPAFLLLVILLVSSGVSCLMATGWILWESKRQTPFRFWKPRPDTSLPEPKNFPPTVLAFGYGRVKIGCVQQGNRHGLILTPLASPEPVGHTFIGEVGKPADIRTGSVLIWVDTIEGYRVLQDSVNALLLALQGYSIVEKTP